MNIKFVVNSGSMIVLNTWQEIIDQKADRWFSHNFYDKCKALEVNKEFEDKLKASRKSLGIPQEGYTPSYYENNIRSKNYPEILNNQVQGEINKLTCMFLFDHSIQKCLPELIYGDFVYFDTFITDTNDISYRLDDYTDEDSEIPDGVVIIIETVVTKNKLIKYIEDNWDGIESELSKLPIRDRYTISNKDLKIVLLKDYKAYSFREIADTLATEYVSSNLYDKINDDSVKTAYSRAKKKIQSLAKLRG